jgi:hypothetical protein
MAPAPLRFTDGWNIGTAELVITMPMPYVVPATGVVEYQHIVIPTGFREDKWVKAVNRSPGTRLAKKGHEIWWEFNKRGDRRYTGRLLVDGNLYTVSEAKKAFGVK